MKYIDFGVSILFTPCLQIEITKNLFLIEMCACANIYSILAFILWTEVNIHCVSDSTWTNKLQFSLRGRQGSKSLSATLVLSTKVPGAWWSSLGSEVHSTFVNWLVPPWNEMDDLARSTQRHLCSFVTFSGNLCYSLHVLPPNIYTNIICVKDNILTQH